MKTRRWTTAFLILFLLLLLNEQAGAFETPYTTNIHRGWRFCGACHQTHTKRTDITIFGKTQNDCNQAICHTGSKDGEGDFEDLKVHRQQIHTRPSICRNCHPKVNGTFQIHAIHVNNSEFDINIQCRLCHQSPKGYNSSIVHVPPSKEVSKPKWGGDCLYCHVAPEKTERLHDFHKPVLLKNRTCQKCHTDTLEPTEEIYRRIAGDIPEWLKESEISGVGDIKEVGDVEKYLTASTIYEESLRYLDQIATEVNKIVLTLKNEVFS